MEIDNARKVRIAIELNDLLLKETKEEFKEKSAIIIVLRLKQL